MMNMVEDEQAKKYFITDVEQVDDSLVVKRADDSVNEESFSEHNLQFYRLQMIEQAKEYLPKFLDRLSYDSFMVTVKKYAAIVLGVVGLFFLYNVPVHLVMKIILSILLLLGEVGYYLYNEIILDLMWNFVREGLATETYLQNLDTFQYFDKEAYLDKFILPPEDIGRYGLTREMIEEMVKTIQGFKEDGVESQDISLTYQKKV